MRHGLTLALSLGVAGAATALAYAPLGWWPVWLVAVAYFFVRLDAAPWRHQLWMGWVFGLSAAIATTHWIGIALWHQAGVPKGVAVAASAMAWLYSAWPWGMVGMVAALVGRWGRGVDASSRPVMPLLIVMILSVGWWSQAWWLSGFPWLVPSVIWLDTPVQGWGAMGGGLLMATLGVVLVLSLAWVWNLYKKRLLSLINKAQAAFIFIVVIGGGAVGERLTWTHAVGPPVRVGAVQVDMPSQSRLDRSQEHAYQRMAWRITETLIQRHQVEVIVWPETLVNSPEPALRTWLAQHDELLQQRSVVMGAGIESAVTAPHTAIPVKPMMQAHNSLVSHGLHSSGRYDKRELVPLIEAWPDSGPWPWLADWASAQPWLQRGADVQPPLQVAGQAVGASICYEDAFPHIYQDLPAAVSWLINASNDGWFARTPVMPAQHMALSRLRALEQQKPLVRAANIGPSAIVDAWGRPIAQTPTGRPQLLYADIQPRQGHTPYARWGHGWLLMVVLAAAVGMGMRIRN